MTVKYSQHECSQRHYKHDAWHAIQFRTADKLKHEGHVSSGGQLQKRTF
jgi:hypothetical protein